MPCAPLKANWCRVPPRAKGYSALAPGLVPRHAPLQPQSGKRSLTRHQIVAQAMAQADRLMADTNSEIDRHRAVAQREVDDLTRAKTASPATSTSYASCSAPRQARPAARPPRPPSPVRSPDPLGVPHVRAERPDPHRHPPDQTRALSRPDRRISLALQPGDPLITLPTLALGKHGCDRCCSGEGPRILLSVIEINVFVDRVTGSTSQIRDHD